MSSSPHPPFNTLSEIIHVNNLSNDFGTLMLNQEFSDIKLIVDGTEIPSHKIILAARSEYFRALLYGGMRESTQDVIHLKGPRLQAFRVLLKYIYSGKMILSEFKEEQVLEILGLAHQYGFVELEDSISEFLKDIVNLRNVCLVYNMASLYQLDSLAKVCCSFVDRNATEILQNDSFLTLSSSALKEMISRNSFCASEIEIFRSIVRWSSHNNREDQESLAGVLSTIRLPLISSAELLNVVRPTGLISPDDLLDAFKVKLDCKDSNLNYRGYLMVDENVASSKHNAQVLQGEMRPALLDGDVNTYDLERGFTRHPIDKTPGEGIMVKLGMPCIVNHMRMLLWDRDIRSYSYYVEVSIDQVDWIRVVDHSKYLCRSWQSLYFSPRVVRYIRIVGTHNTVNRVFHAVQFECMYTSRPFIIENGLLVPSFNVATSACSACVIEGVSRSRSALINGQMASYDWDSGYTCHQLGSGAIVVQLAQPYMLDSMTLLLWDCDDRTYCYYIEVSVDQVHWKMIVDKQEEASSSWQYIKFPLQPVVFVRIVGTHNTANEVFHCVHFECPSQSTHNGTSQSTHNGTSQSTHNGISLSEDKSLNLK